MNEQFEASLDQRRRQLSRFMARELLLDYAENRLDADRRIALEEYLPRDKEAQKELESLRLALAYADALARIEAAPRALSRIENTKLGMAKITDRLAWRNWPEVARWSVEAVLVSVVVAVVVSLLPLQKLAAWLPSSSQEVVLAEIESPPEARISETGDAVEPTAPSTAATPPANTSAVMFGPSTEDLKSGSVVLPVIPAPQDVAAAEAEEPAPKTEKAPKGFVYRAFMASSSIDESTTSVRDLILSLGGVKAGQVDLGWRKNTGTYFHFSIPESNYETLMSSLRTFSPVRIYKDPHWRVMPEGQIRLILFIEDTASKK